MATEFSTRIRLCRGVPIDADYENTLFFDDEEKRRNYFRAVTNFAFEEQSYQRVNRNTIKVQKNRDVLDTINYMVIENVAHTDKWYYCFVLQVNYINENTTEIVYDIDVIQTWLGNCTIGKSFVERNHTLSDKIGEHIIPENFELGDGYVCSKMETVAMKCDTALIYRQEYDVGAGEGLNYVFNYPTPAEGAFFHDLDTNEHEREAFREMCVEYRSKVDQIYNGFLVPNVCVQMVSKPAGRLIGITHPETFNIDALDRIRFTIPNNIDGYENVKNNKLFTYPYCCLQIDNTEGQINTYKFEDFDTDLKSFSVVALPIPAPEVDLVPRHYKGIDINQSERITMKEFPVIPFSGDKADTYYYNNKNSIALGYIASAIATIGGVATAVGKPVAQTIAITPYGGETENVTHLSFEGGNLSKGSITAGAGIMGALSQVAKINDLKRQPDSISTINASSLFSIQTNKKEFILMCSTVKKEYAMMIDDFFTKYGYAIKRVTDPILKARTEWTYIKTAGMVLFGKISQEVEVKIKQIFDSGITFWVNPLHVGDYTLDNDPLGERPEPTPTPDPEPSNFVPRLNDSKLTSSRYWQEPFNRYVTPPNAIHLPACSTYAYGRTLEIAYHYGNGALIMRSDGVAGQFNWRAGRNQYASPNTTGDHYAYPSGENCMDACVCGGWSADTHPRLGDVVSYYYEDPSIPDGHVLVVEQILHYDSNGHADWIRCSESNSGGPMFDLRELRRNYYRTDTSDWMPTPASKGLWYDGQGRHPKKWCGGFAHNPAIDYVGG